MINSECSDTIEDLNLMFTADFSSKENCELILQLIDRALSLKKCNIKQNDENDKRVFVEIKYAQESDEGQLWAKAKGEVELEAEMSTERTI